MLAAPICVALVTLPTLDRRHRGTGLDRQATPAYSPTCVCSYGIVAFSEAPTSQMAKGRPLKCVGAVQTSAEWWRAACTLNQCLHRQNCFQHALYVMTRKHPKSFFGRKNSRGNETVACGTCKRYNT